MRPSDDLEDFEQYRKRVQERFGTGTEGAVPDAPALVEHRTTAVDCCLTLADRAFLRTMGITADTRAYDMAPLPEAAKERAIYPASFSIRLTHICDSIIALERLGHRPANAEYRDLLERAFFSSEIRYLPAGGIETVQSELLDLELEHPSTLIPSDRCADLLKRVDPLVHKYYTTSWPVADLGWGWC